MKTTTELIWLLGLLKDLGVNIAKPVKVYSDSKVALQIAVNPVFHERIKHIKIDCHFVREKVQQGLKSTQYINTKEQLADLLTKGLTKVQLEYLKNKLGVINIFSTPSLRESADTDSITW